MLGILYWSLPSSPFSGLPGAPGGSHGEPQLDSTGGTVEACIDLPPGSLLATPAPPALQPWGAGAQWVKMEKARVASLSLIDPPGPWPPLCKQPL